MSIYRTRTLLQQIGPALGPADGSRFLLSFCSRFPLIVYTICFPLRTIREWIIRVINGLLSSLYRAETDAPRRILALVSYRKKESSSKVLTEHTLRPTTPPRPLKHKHLSNRYDIRIRKTNVSPLEIW